MCHDEDLIPHGVGNLSFYKENGDSVVKMMSPTPLQELINLRWYIQHLIHESGYLYDDDESNYPLSEDKWMLQTHGKFMKYVFYILHRMTPEQMKNLIQRKGSQTKMNKNPPYQSKRKMNFYKEKYTEIKIKAMRCLVCVLFLIIIVCKDDVFLAFKAINCKKFCTRVYRTATANGIDCCNNQTLRYCIATTHFSWMGLKCYN